jgi:hypothetical protein
MAEKALIMLHDVRVSFPHLWRKPVINGKEGKFGAVLLLDKREHAQLADFVRQWVEYISVQEHKKVLPMDKLCLRDGDESVRTEYAGFWELHTNSESRPRIISHDGVNEVVDENQCRIVAGCRVNAKVEIWPMNNKHGRRVNASLLSIQYNRPDVVLDSSYVPPEIAKDGFGPVNPYVDDNF